ncbi:MAG: winged helix DNA-binding domain-containing protein [Actinomycetota bacterium]|nr:winged helix DNA-binding domain-containing protein [Actinomycetota bacterium]
MAVAAQGLAEPRPSGRIDRRHLRKVFARIGVIQIDSVNVLVRSQELPLFARLGPHPRTLLPDALDDGELFEYWAHMAAIVPSAHHHLFRWRMATDSGWKMLAELRRRRPGYVDEVLERVRADGPLTAADLAQRVGPKGTWWDWDDGKVALECLFGDGHLAARRRATDFARLYDVPERIIPAAALARPTPAEPDARKELLVLAARSMGVATFADLTDYHRQRNPPCRPLLPELVEDGRLLRAEVEGWTEPAYVLPGAVIPRRITGRALLSPFDSLVWHRERTLRLFGFHYRIEIYVPAPKRQFGYYVLPFLLDGRLVGRVDLKADRARGVLVVQAAHAEAALADRCAAAEQLGGELASLAGWLGLHDVEVAGRGDFVLELAAAGGATT